MFNIFVLECIWYKVNNYEHGKEFTNFLDTILKAECFLQVRFCLETTLGGSMNSVSKLIHYVGWLSTTAMRLENNSTFLLHFILDFYEKVCDIYINYNLPLVVLFPPGVFYPALLSLDSSILNQLCYIMDRYRKNLTAAKKNELVQKTKSEFSFSSKTYQEFNHYLTAMVGCLWTSKPFQKGLYIDPEVLEKASVAEYKNSLNLVHHPALLSYAVFFLLQVRVFK
ncbi:hypothetical protein J1605_007346 [Eschrichtius robustus]|uniref:Centromere protein I n=1 Tax=Eschrichtius robustus TaxID=9764 RepID=A0AB34H0V0_ESCRO|nr:hypothetical protein J1605_007346 [Eschrichtius robustus]